MKSIEIHPNNTLKEIKNAFESNLDQLKIEFYNNVHQNGEGSPISEQVKDLNVTLGEISSLKMDQKISLDGHKKVATLENEFKSIGVNVQVFRKSGKVWLQTITTDNWTLAQQNEEALKAFH